MAGYLRRGIPALLALAVLLAAGVVVSQWSDYHDFSGRCLECHISEPEPGADLTAFKMDISRMCYECHDDVRDLSHPVDITPSMPVPSAFPLDWKGQITCTTCHPAHGPGRGPFHLRWKVAGQGFCVMCHDDLSEELHKVSLGSAHVTASTGAGFDVASAANTLDELSIKCLSCHDAVFSSDSPVTRKGPVSGFFHNISTIGLSHPIGMSYVEVNRRADGAYRDLDELPKEIRIFGGIVGCGSCHNPYSKRHSELVMSNEGSGLCLACHIK